MLTAFEMQTDGGDFIWTVTTGSAGVPAKSLHSEEEVHVCTRFQIQRRHFSRLEMCSYVSLRAAGLVAPSMLCRAGTRQKVPLPSGMQCLEVKHVNAVARFIVEFVFLKYAEDPLPR